jgi:hypothetical protein
MRFWVETNPSEFILCQTVTPATSRGPEVLEKAGFRLVPE